jgi:hypothetical protein
LIIQKTDGTQVNVGLSQIESIDFGTNSNSGYSILPENVIYLENFEQVVSIPYSTNNVEIQVSGSIYGEDGSPSTNDPIHLLIVGASDEQDGSALVSKTFEGTHYYNDTPQTWNFTSNSGTNNLWVVAIADNFATNLVGEYIVTVNGVESIISSSNVIYLIEQPEIVTMEYENDLVSMVVSGSIYGEDNSPSTNDPIQLLIVGTSDEQDGSALVSETFDGTHYYSPEPQTWSYNSNIATRTAIAVGISTSYNANNIGFYHIEIE